MRVVVEGMRVGFAGICGPLCIKLQRGILITKVNYNDNIIKGSF